MAKFFNLSTPSMRKVDDGEKRQRKIKKEQMMLFIVSTNGVAGRPPER